MRYVAPIAAGEAVGRGTVADHGGRSGRLATLVIEVDLSASVLENWYRGRVTHVQTRAHDGRSVRLPIARFRPWIGHRGLSGRFRLTLDGTRFVGLEPLS